MKHGERERERECCDLVSILTPDQPVIMGRSNQLVSRPGILVAESAGLWLFTA